VTARAQDLARARALARRLVALENGPMRIRAAARALAAETASSAAQLLADAVALAGEGESALAAALGDALLTPGPELVYDQVAALYAAAVAAGHDDVRRLVLAAPPRRPYHEPRDRADPGLGHLTLGHKKARARGDRDPDLLARLAAEGEPVVVRELLRNPRLTEELVVRIAARRPCRPETLRCLHDDRRWSARPAVARAIALNPFAEPELVAKLLPRLGTRELAAISADGSLHALVRGLASRLVSGRTGGTGTPPAGRSR
jgi:hypothetical protein